MDRILIRGGVPLSGTIQIGGAKNAALPLMAASLLDGRDAGPDQRAGPRRHQDDGESAGAARRRDRFRGQHARRSAAMRNRGTCCELSARHITSTTAPYDLVRKMRASVLVLGPLVARCGRGRVSLPGGCAIGTRPVDLHLKGLERLGAEVDAERGLYRGARAERAARRRIRVPERLGRRHRKPADGGHPGRGRDGADQRRARARDHRSGALPRRDGRRGSTASAPTG